MSDKDNSRLKQYEKRRRNNKFINYFAMIASVLIVALIGIWIFGGGDEEIADTPPTEQPDQEQDDGSFLVIEDDDESEEETTDNEDEQENDTETSEENNESTKENTNENTNENDSNETENEEREVEYNDVVVEHEESDDSNVIEAYTGNWPPIGTEQTGPHTTVYTDGSQDRIEIKRAVSYVTGIPEDEVIELWVGNGGDQKVIATVTDSSQLEIFRVYLSWVDEEGWQPTRFEVLHENDAQ